MRHSLLSWVTGVLLVLAYPLSSTCSAQEGPMSNTTIEKVAVHVDGFMRSKSGAI